MTGKLYDHLSVALDQLEAGETLESVLAAHPEHAAQLEPILQAAQIAWSQPDQEVSPQVLSRSRTRVLAHAMQLRRASPVKRSAWGGFRRLAIALVIALAFLLSWGGLMVTSARALPGDQLYPAKLTLEKVRLGLTFSPESHKQVEELYQSRRVDEVHSLLKLGRTVLVEFHGVVDEQQVGEWLISGIRVRLDPTTVVMGQILPGMTAEVEGLTQPDGAVQASEIHLQTFGFVGYVESIADQAWRIGGVTVQITPESEILAGISVGDWVTVEVRSDDFGNLTALVITGSNLPTPTPTPLPTATATPTQVPQKLLDMPTQEDRGDESDEQGTSDLDTEDGSGVEQEEFPDPEEQPNGSQEEEDEVDQEKDWEKDDEKDSD